MRHSNKRLFAIGLIGAALIGPQNPRAHAQDTASSKGPSSARGTQHTGEALYQAICQGCHMPDAKGAVGAGAYPGLARNARLAVAAYPLTVVVNGQKAMPPFGDDLTDQEIANVVNYVRSHFGNTYTDAASAAEVKELRQSRRRE